MVFAQCTMHSAQLIDLRIQKKGGNWLMIIVFRHFEPTFPTTGRVTDPQVSAAQCTTPDRKSDNRAPKTEMFV